MSGRNTDAKLRKAYKKFEAEYRDEVQEMLVLTSESVGGASSYEKGIWRPSAEILASVDLETGEFREEKGSLLWIAGDNDREGWIHQICPLTIYHVRCRKRIGNETSGETTAADKNIWMLVEVAGRSLEHPKLEKVRKEYQRVVEFTDTLCGRFELERMFDWFRADIDWLGEVCSVSLTCDEEGGETADGALAFFKTIYESLQEWDRKFRAFAAEELTSDANEWLMDSEEENPEPITEESFAKRIRISEFVMESGGYFTAYYKDDDMFWGHIILIEGNMESGIEDAYIAG